jgi:hypothetical protein
MGGCGCKNKNTSQPAQPAQAQQARPQNTNENVQNSVHKMIEKYYKNKR